jgi:hypothetical protein
MQVSTEEMVADMLKSIRLQVLYSGDVLAVQGETDKDFIAFMLTGRIGISFHKPGDQPSVVEASSFAKILPKGSTIGADGSSSQLIEKVSLTFVANVAVSLLTHCS